jgi:mono/diheme cytochrome c family protein
VQRILVAAISFLLLVPFVHSQKQSHSASSVLVERGKYLVVDVGMCGDCHTPHDQKGEPIQDRWLRGAAIEFKPTVPIPVWADQAPDLAGLPGWTKDAAIKFFRTGIGYNGLPRRPPMPQFRFNQQDAEAVVAYLKSLQPK